MKADWIRPGYAKNLLIELKARRYRDPLERLAYLRKAQNRTSIRRVRLAWCVGFALLLFAFFGAKVQTVSNFGSDNSFSTTSALTPDPADFQSRTKPVKPGSAWLVEQGPDYEVYSNGLRIENRFVSPNFPRSYVIFRNGQPGKERRSKPAGIVFHTSESILAPFESRHNEKLTRLGSALLQYVSRERCYHFLIDRFGRVFRIVPETDVANHAGYSVWEDSEGVYVNLNHSFLGVSFEAQTKDLDHGPYLSGSQINSGRQLVEALTSKYKIPLDNCITHAQVSVDPVAMTIGHHTDGAGDFPFREMGVPDNYALPIPSLYRFGFDYDAKYLMLAGTRLWKGLILADERLRREAASKNLPIREHKETLRKQYRASIETLKTMGIIKEN